jgi:hypothetical protein
MFNANADALKRAFEYAMRRGLTLKNPLGAGVDGVVLSTDVATAVKSLKYEFLYRQELAVYRRLEERHVDKICGFWVPRLIDHHDELWIVEIEFVVPPFIVDFATAGVDADPLQKYSPEELEEWLESRRELFEDRWPTAMNILHGFREFGIYLVDLKPGNIMFAD